MDNINKARQLAHEAHDSIGQKRKYTGEPYWEHTDAVAETVASVGGTEDMICAAHLHDYSEDVTPNNPNYPIGLILDGFSTKVLQLVIELTDVYTKLEFPHLNRAERKAKECERCGTMSAEAKTIKLADILNNSASIVEHDSKFAKTYLKEVLNMLPFLIGGNSELLNKVACQTVAACSQVGVNIPTLSKQP